MTHDQWQGLITLIILLYPTYSPRLRRIRKLQRAGQWPPPRASASPVSRNTPKDKQTGPLWEQDVPFAEAFEEDL